jgi:hypothetical protein
VGIGFNIIGRKAGEEIKKFVSLIFEARKDDNRNALLYNSSGEDSVPLDDERLVLVKVDGAGKYAAVAVLTQSQGAKPGEKIFFARDTDAKIVSKISMLNDGSVIMEADGDITHNTKKNINNSADENIAHNAKKDYSINADKNINMEAKEKATMKGVDVELNGKVKATGGSFECGGQVAPMGQGALCGCKYCYVTGAPVAGNKAEGT